MNVQVSAVRIHKLVQSSWDLMVAPQRSVSLVQEHQPLSAVDVDSSTARPSCQLTHVCSLARVHPNKDKRLRACKYLRCVEQAEWAQRPWDERGTCAQVEATDTILQHTAEPVEAQGLAADSTGRTTSVMSTTNLLPSMAMADVKNGRTSCLYSPLQLHTERRQRAQCMLLQAELDMTHIEFATGHDDAQQRKEVLKGTIQEHMRRLREIQTELKSSAQSALPLGINDENPQSVLHVHDAEVPMAKYESPDDRCASGANSDNWLAGFAVAVR
jgi:hypothetical protein